MTVLEQLQNALVRWRTANPGAERSRVYFKLTEQMVRDACIGLLPLPDDMSVAWDGLYMCGVQTYEVLDVVWSGLYDRDSGNRVAGPFLCPRSTPQVTETPQNTVDGMERFGRLSEAQVTELIEWFISLAAATDASQVTRVPSFYVSTSAWLQMNALGMVDERSDMMPWNMPRPLAEYFSDVWYAQRVAIVATQQREKDEALRRAVNGHE